MYLEMLAALVPQQGVQNSHSKPQGDQCQIGDPQSRDSHTVLRKAPSFLLPKKKKWRAFQPEENRGGREITGARLAGRPTAEDLDRLKLWAQ